MARTQKSEKPLKCKTNPSVRVIEGRINDSRDGKYCHQCRQKRMNFVESCKVMKKNKLCTIKFCHQCLSLRYGENPEEVVTLDHWACPQCRGICNCSVCRVSRGLSPTGILAHKAKACGFASVSELLEVEGHDKFAYQKKPKVDVASMEGCSGNGESVPEIGVGISCEIDAAKEKKKSKKAKSNNKLKEETQIEAQLPQGISLTSVSGIDIPFEEAGNVCQFFEFCLTFGKVLGLKEGQAKTVVRELFLCARNTKRHQYCSVIQLMIQLLDIISYDRDTPLSLSAFDSSWFTALGGCLMQSEVSIDEFPPETFVTGVAAYEKMNASRKLKLLNFLCDESLSTWEMRNCIKSQSDDYKIKVKEVKQKGAAAKENEKQLRQKLQGDVAKAVMEKNGAPLSIEEHNSIMSQIKAEAKEATLICDAHRTEPIMLDDNGLVLWKLKCYEEEPNFLLQDLGTFDDLYPHEKWSYFKPEQKLEIENYLSYKRRKLMQRKKKAIVEKSTNAEASNSAPSPNSNLIISEQY